MIKKLIRGWRYGEPVIVVSGLPRSGTSMLMSMLDAGGLVTMTDSVRAADDDNPKGYFELARVKSLDTDPDKSWVREGRGKAIKVISHLLKDLPNENFYRVIFARRDLAEVVASQNIMLERRREPNPVEDTKAVDLYRKHLVNVRVMVRRRPNFEMLEISYRETLNAPDVAAASISRFLDRGLDVERMEAVVDRGLYRNRRESLATG